MTNDVINNLCEKFGVTVEYLIPRMIAYYRAEIIGQVLLFVVTLVVSAYVLRRLLKASFDKDNDFDPDFGSLMGVILGSAGCVTGFFGTMDSIVWLMKLLASPEYFVIQKLIEQVR